MEPQAVIDTFKRVVTRHYFDFEGRTGRREFWYYILAYVVLAIAVAIVASVLFLPVLSSLLWLALFFPTLGIGVRRLHDIGRSGWWMLIYIPLAIANASRLLAFALGGWILLLLTGMVVGLISLVAAVVLIYWFAQPGSPGANQYGSEPAGAPAPSPAGTATS